MFVLVSIHPNNPPTHPSSALTTPLLVQFEIVVLVLLEKPPKGARVVAQLVIGVVRMSIVAGSILVGASFLPTIARADI